MKYKIIVSGASAPKYCCKGTEKLSREIGEEISRKKCILLTGATTGLPHTSALAYKKLGGLSLGFSPAASESSHVKTYKLPTDGFDAIVYTGEGYIGRDILMTKAGDAMIIICGSLGTLHEFIVALELRLPIGVLEGTGGTADKIRGIIKGPLNRPKKIVYDKDPKRLVEKLIALTKKDKLKNSKRKAPKKKKVFS